jgi:hypothetical protein
MSDPLTTGANLAAIFSATLQAIEVIADRAKKSGDTELVRDVIAAQSKLMELQSKMMASENENQGLRKEVQKLKELGDLVYNDGCFWEKKGDGWDGPFCSPCKGEKGIKIHMDFPPNPWTHESGKNPQCPSCNHWGQVDHPQPPR